MMKSAVCIGLLVVHVLAGGGHAAPEEGVRGATGGEVAARVMAAMGTGFEVPDVLVHHKMSGAPHNLGTWKRSVDYMIDGHPKRADHRGGNIIDNSMEDAVPSTFKGMETMWNGVRVVLDRPSHVVRPQDLTRIGVAVNTALARNTYVADKKTTCFCKMLVQIRCACTNPEKAAMDRLREEKEKKMKRLVRIESGNGDTAQQRIDVAEMRARSEQREKSRVRHAVHVQGVYSKESNRTMLLAKRLEQHREGAAGKREARLASEMATLPYLLRRPDWGHRGADGETPVPVVQGPKWANGSLVSVKPHAVALGSCLSKADPCKWSAFHAVTMSRPADNGPRFADLQSAKDECEVLGRDACIAIVRVSLRVGVPDTHNHTKEFRELAARPYLLRVATKGRPEIDETVWASLWTRECGDAKARFGPSKEGLAQIVSTTPDGYVNVMYVDDGRHECRLSPSAIHAPSKADRERQDTKREKTHEEMVKEHVRLIQQVNARNAESKLMVQAIKLMQNETIERTREYLKIEKQTVRNNEEVNKMLKRDRYVRHKHDMDELRHVTISGYEDLKHVEVKSRDELALLNKKIKGALTLQKQEADKEVLGLDTNVSAIQDSYRKLQLVPIPMVEEQDPRFVKIRDRRDAVAHDYKLNEGKMKEEQKKRLDAIQRARQEELQKRNETDTLESDLQAQLKAVETEMDRKRKHRIKTAEENEKRRVLPPLPPLHPVLPKCGPTPGWLLGKDQQTREIGKCLAPTERTEVFPFLREIFRDGSISSGCAAMGRNISYLQVLHRLSDRRGPAGHFAKDLAAQRKDMFATTGSRGGSNRPVLPKQRFSFIEAGSRRLRSGQKAVALRGRTPVLPAPKPSYPFPFTFTLRRGGQKGHCNGEKDNCFMKGDDLFVRVSCKSNNPNAVADWASSVKKNSAEPEWNEEVQLNATGSNCWMHVHECDRSAGGKWCSGDLVPNKNTELLGTFPIPTLTSKVHDAHIYLNCGLKKKEGSGCGWIWFETKSPYAVEVETKPLDFVLKRGGQKGKCSKDYDNCFMKGDDLFVRVSCESPDPYVRAQWVSSVKMNAVAPVWNERVRLNATGDKCWMHVHECDRSASGKLCEGDLVPNSNTEHLGTYIIPAMTNANEIHINQNCGNKKKEGSGCGWIWFDTAVPVKPVQTKQLNFNLGSGGAKPGAKCNNFDNCFMKGDDVYVRLSCESADPNEAAQWVSSTSRNTATPIWNQGAILNVSVEKDMCWMHVHHCKKDLNQKFCSGDLLPNDNAVYLGTYEVPIKDDNKGRRHVVKNCADGKPGSAGCGWIFFTTYVGPLDTTRSWQCMGLTNQGSVYFGQHLLVPKGEKNAKMLCEALTCLCEVDPSHKAGSCMDRLQSEESRTNSMWKSVMREKIHQLEKAYSGKGDAAAVESGGNRQGGSQKSLVSSPSTPGLFHRLQAQKKELERATKTLNAELAGRYGNGPSINKKQAYNVLHDGAKTGTHEHPGGGNEAVIYKSLEQIRILRDETDHLRADLKKCKVRPQDFVPGCAADLEFQINRLQDEVENRVAYLAQKRVESETRRSALQSALKECNKPSGKCTTAEEQNLIMEMKQVTTEIDIRQRAQTDMDWRRLYGCLWKYRTVGQVHSVEKWFTEPHVDMSRGCAKLKPVKNMKILHQCLCAEDSEIKTIIGNVKFVAAKKLAADRLEKATEDYNRKKNEKKREKEKETAKQIAQNIVYDNLESQGQLDTKLREAVKDRNSKPQVSGKVAQMVNAGKAAIQAEQKAIAGASAGGGCPKDVDCKEHAGGAGVDMKKLENCLGRSDSEVVKANLRKAFTTGNLQTGCALLSLASNPMLQEIHGCMCTNGPSGKSARGEAAKVAGVAKSLVDKP